MTSYENDNENENQLAETYNGNENDDFVRKQ